MKTYKPGMETNLWYGCESWFNLNQELSKLESTQYDANKRLLGLSRGTPNPAI